MVRERSGPKNYFLACRLGKGELLGKEGSCEALRRYPEGPPFQVSSSRPDLTLHSHRPASVSEGPVADPAKRRMDRSRLQTQTLTFSRPLPPYLPLLTSSGFPDLRPPSWSHLDLTLTPALLVNKLVCSQLWFWRPSKTHLLRFALQHHGSQ